MSLISQRIAQHCQRLKLIHLATEWPAIADAAAKHQVSLADFLDKLLSAECTARDQRTREAMLKLATLPAIKTRFIPAADPMIQLAPAKAQGRITEYTNRAVIGPRLLVINALGYLPFGREEANLVFRVIAKRYERSSTVVTSNLPFTQWASTLAEDATLTTALPDRLLHHANIAQIDGESYRLKDRKKAGHLQVPVGA
jgi:DNA replication protein DnaC